MHIIFGEQNTQEVRQKYTVLTLDTFRLTGSTEPVTAFCVLDTIGLEQMTQLNMWKDLHENLLQEYRIKNWKYCEDALEHLRGQWQGQLDSFYDDLGARIAKYKEQDPGPDWQGIYDRTAVTD
jgi:hypothetical protein